MPKERKKVLCMDAQRHAEYYGMQRTFDELYAKSKAGETFTGLMELVLSPDNIMLAYRNIKTNTGSYTAGTDKQNIGDIGRLPPAEVIGKVRKIVTGSEHGYRPKPVRRKDIPKPNGKTRPLGIPCIWDRLVQQCIKQILEPICEAKFSNNSYGFRPNRSVEHAISRTYSLLQRAHLHYVLEFDIKGFFDNVNHSKLIKQLWTMGIQDKQLLFVIKRILKAPIRMPDGSTVYPTKGTPQGGIISPLLANVVLNELDHWIDSQWTEHPVANRYGTWRTIRTSEVFDKSKGYQKMRNSNLKEMFIVRYADDFRIFCRNREDAEKTMEAVTRWITERLKIEVSPEKTRIPIAFIKYKTAIGISAAVCCFSPMGRKKIHDNLEMDTTLFAYLREHPPEGHSLEYADCRLSLLSAQKGKCAVSGELFLQPDSIVCHMKVPKKQGGQEQYSNLVLLHGRYLPLLIDQDATTLKRTCKQLAVTRKQLTKINNLRIAAKLAAI